MLVDISRGNGSWVRLAEMGVLLILIQGAWRRKDDVGNDGVAESLTFTEGEIEVASLRA